MRMPKAKTDSLQASSTGQPAFNNMMSSFLGPNSGTATPASLISTTPSQIADAMIRAMLGGAGTATTATPTSLGTANTTDTPGSNSAATTDSNQLPTKQLRTFLDLPSVTTVVVTPVTVLVADPTVATVLDPKMVPTEQAAAGTQSTLAPLAAPTKNLPLAKLAFSATLTPMNIADAAKQAATAAEPSSSLVPASEPVQTAAPTSSSSDAQSTGVQGLSAQAVIQPVAEKTSGDAQQQQGHDSPDTRAQAGPVMETKLKQAKQNEVDSTPAFAGREVTTPTVPMTVTPTAAPAHTAAAPAESSTVPPSHSTAEALRTSESNLPAAAPLRTGVAQEISIRIAPPDAPAVDLRIVERAGQVHIDVRTSDAGMQTTLRQDLGTLTNSLQRAGYHAETFTPATGTTRMTSSAQTENQDRQQDPSQNRGGSGDSNGERRQQQKRSGKWLEELEKQ